MARTKEERILYNKEIKQFFLDKYEEGTQVNYSRIFSRANTLEEFYQKDIATFSMIQLDEFLKSQIFTTFQAVHIYVSCISNYIEFCKENNYFNLDNNSYNWARGIKGAEGLDNYIYKQAKDRQYITREELHQIMDFCVNAQDSILFGLLFEGIKGRKGIEELVNLKEDEIKFFIQNSKEVAELTLTYTSKEGKQATRIVVIEDNIIVRYLHWALEQEEYEKNNGVNEHLKVPTYELAKTEYLFKVSGRENYGMIKEQNLYNRLNKISKLFNNTFLNPTSVWVSGMVEMGTKIKNSKGGRELVKEDYELINSHYNYDQWHTTKTKIKKFI